MSAITPTRPAGFSPTFPLPSFSKKEFVPPNHPALNPSETLKLTDLPPEMLALIASKFKNLNDYGSFVNFRCSSKIINKAVDSLPTNKKPQNQRKLLKQVDQASKRKREQAQLAHRKAHRPTMPINLNNGF